VSGSESHRIADAKQNAADPIPPLPPVSHQRCQTQSCISTRVGDAASPRAARLQFFSNIAADSAALSSSFSEPGNENNRFPKNGDKLRTVHWRYLTNHSGFSVGARLHAVVCKPDKWALVDSVLGNLTLAGQDGSRTWWFWKATARYQ
jgi:hypothetical protein